MTAQLLNSATTTVTGSPFQALRDDLNARVSVGVAQCQFNGGTATILIEGRAATNAPWTTIATFTADGAQAIQLMREVRARVSSYSSGPLNVWLNI